MKKLKELTMNKEISKHDLILTIYNYGIALSVLEMYLELCETNGAIPTIEDFQLLITSNIEALTALTEADDKPKEKLSLEDIKNDTRIM